MGGENQECKNKESCFLLHKSTIVNEKREKYVTLYCNAAFESCKRFQMSQKYHFCPDFVLPDTDLEFEQILEQYENS